MINHQKFVINRDNASKAAVINGSDWFKSSYNSSTWGKTVVSIKIMTPIMTTTTMAGYTSAPRTFDTTSASFSCWVAIRSKAWSSVPDASPAAIRDVKTVLKTLGCFSKDLANEF